MLLPAIQVPFDTTQAQAGALEARDTAISQAIDLPLHATLKRVFAGSH
jgi:hypothetical protein